TEARTNILLATAVDQLGQAGTSAPVVVRIFVPEFVRPTVLITNSPRNFGRFRDPHVTLGGTAADKAELVRVEYVVNAGPHQLASGLERWLIETNRAPGMNTIRVRSVDLTGNFSFDATRFLTFVVNTSLLVTVVGEGTVSPDLNSQVLEMGKVY